MGFGPTLIHTPESASYGGASTGASTEAVEPPLSARKAIGLRAPGPCTEGCLSSAGCRSVNGTDVRTIAELRNRRLRPSGPMARSE
jgi:hypothetical protein